MHRFLLFLVFSISLVSVWSASKLDSLLSNLERVSDAEELLEAHAALAGFYVEYSYEKCIYHSHQALSLSPVPRSDVMYALGKTHWYHSKYDSAIHWLDQTIRVSGQSNELDVYSRALHIKGMVHFYQAHFDSAIYYLTQTLTELERAGDTSQLALVNNDLGWVYDKIGDYRNSTEAFMKAYRIDLRFQLIMDQSNSTGDDFDPFNDEAMNTKLMSEAKSERMAALNRQDAFELADALFRISHLHRLLNQYDSALYVMEESRDLFDSIGARTHYGETLLELGRIYEKMDKDIDALEYYKKAIGTFISEHFFPRVDLILELMGELCLRSGRYQEATGYYQQGLILSDTIGHPMAVSLFHRRFSELYLKQGLISESIHHGRKAYEVAKRIGAISGMRNSALKLYEAFKEGTRPDSALYYYEKYTEMTAAREQALVDRSRQEFQISYDVSSKVQQIQNLNIQNEEKERRIRYQGGVIALATMGVISMLIVALILRKRVLLIRQLNRQIRQRSDENEHLLAEVHHRVKNNLQMISSIIGMQSRRLEGVSIEEVLKMTKNRIQTIGLLHEHLYHQGSLSGSNLKNYIPSLVQMIVKSQGQIDPTVEYQIEVEKSNLDQTIPIALILNELVTNCLKYAFETHPDPQIKVKVWHERQNLTLQVQDNGTGPGEFKKGFGWTIIDSLVEGQGGTIFMNSSQGLSVKIGLPLHGK